MEKLIATTDLSPNSRAGMRFAIQLAQKRGAALCFLHVCHVLRASFWTDQEYAHFIHRSKEAIMEELPGFVKAVYRSMKMPAANYELAVHQNLDTVNGIIEYSEQYKADYICISTRGAGTFKKLFGTNTSKLISNSPLPVLCIPSAYRVTPITQVLYASDMTNYEAELAQVLDFARPLAAEVHMLHLSYPYEFVLDKSLMEATLEEKLGYKVSLQYRSRDTVASLLEDLSSAIGKTRPSVLAMFTNQDRDFFDRVFLSSKAREYSFHARVPLLSFRKG